MATQFRVQRFVSRAEIDTALAQRLREEVEQRGEAAALMLSGGSTPLAAYRALAGQALSPSPQLSIFYSDDRHVPADSDASNFHQSQPLLAAVRLPEDRIHRVRTELPLEQAAEDYERQLAALLRTATLRFGLLGLGADGHTASLFSADDVQRARGKLAIPVHRPDGLDAVSVSPEMLSLFDSLLFVVAGADKRSALQGLLSHDPSIVAVGAVAGRDDVEVWADAAAM